MTDPRGLILGDQGWSPPRGRLHSFDKKEIVSPSGSSRASMTTAEVTRVLFKGLVVCPQDRIRYGRDSSLQSVNKSQIIAT